MANESRMAAPAATNKKSTLTLSVLSFAVGGGMLLFGKSKPVTIVGAVLTLAGIGGAIMDWKNKK